MKKFDLIGGKKIKKKPIKLEILGNWVDDLIWCPSQLYLDVQWRTQKYMLYVRWRHDDPWTLRIIKNYGDKNEEWTDDLFGKYNVFLKESDKIDYIHSEAIRIATKFLSHNKFSDYRS